MENREALANLMNAVLITRTRDEWIAAFDAAGVPAGPVHSLAEALTHPQTLDYAWRVALGWEMVYRLPGAFPTNPFPHDVNGSLWTLPIELRLYRADQCCTVVATVLSRTFVPFTGWGSVPDGDYKLRFVPTGPGGFRGEWYGTDHPADFQSAATIHLDQNLSLAQELIAARRRR